MNDYANVSQESVRAKLEEEKTALQVQIDELLRQDPFTDPERLNDNAASDMEASEGSDHERVNAQIAELRARIEAIDKALLAIREGTFGLCGDCGARIEEERLKILPTATRCIACQKQAAGKAQSS